ncbi:MAG: IreB family regulatory phosphoprotein [Ruminococcaceae bacterium]|nr:IreB family regulatory phosphoprotein [Oscillospiraceae bacterium]
MIIENNDRKILIGKNFSEPAPKACDDGVDSKELLYKICKTVTEGGYNAVSQLMGYIISEDPAHISNYNNARTLIGRIDRDELLEDMINTYLEKLEAQYGNKDSDDGL